MIPLYSTLGNKSEILSHKTKLIRILMLSLLSPNLQFTQLTPPMPAPGVELWHEQVT